MPRAVHRGHLPENDCYIDEPIAVQTGPGNTGPVAAVPRLCIRKEQLLGLLEVGRENDIQQPSLPHRSDLRHAHDFPQSPRSIDALHATWTLSDEHGPIG